GATHSPSGVGRLTLKYRHEPNGVVRVGNSRSLEWVYAGYGFAFDGFGDRCHASDGSGGIRRVLYRPFDHVGWIDFVLLDGAAPAGDGTAVLGEVVCGGSGGNP